MTDSSIEVDGLTGGYPVDSSVVPTAITIHVKFVAAASFVNF
jgi:hypothetical protein